MTISKKDQLAYWSSEAFLNQYFYQLKFNEPYSKATGSIAGGWVRNPWDGRMKKIVFHFVKDYVKNITYDIAEPDKSKYTQPYSNVEKI